MDSQADRSVEHVAENLGEKRPPKPRTSGANGTSGSSHIDLASWYLEELRALRRVQPPGGPRYFNPDETPEELDAQMRQSLLILESMRAGTEEEVEEQKATWAILEKALGADDSSDVILRPDEDK